MAFIEVKYSNIPLLRPPNLLKTLFAKFKLFFSSFFYIQCTSDYRPPLRPLLDSPKGGLNIGISL